MIIVGGDSGRIEASTRFWPSVSGAGFAVLELTVMGIQTIVLPLLISPVGPPIVLALGGIFVWLMGRLLSPMLRGPAANAATNALSTVALLFWGAATALTLSLRLQSAAPVFSIPWQPFFATGADLLWVGNGWNWYVSCLILLLGGGGLLFSGFGGQRMGRVSDEGQQDTGLTLSLSLIAIASALFFTSSDNLLTLTLMWVVMDLFIIGRNAIVPTVHGPSPTRQFQGLSMVGALLLLIGLLPAGQSGPAETLAGGQLPQETVILMLLAGVIRAGVYPLHLWLLPHRGERLYMPDRLIDQMPPALCGLWLLGWSSGLAAEGLLAQPEVIALAILGLLGSAIATFTTTTRQEHTTFVLITSVGVAGLASILSEVRGPAAVLWPTTTFALGGGLWLIGERIWRTWHWQIPISAGVLALVGVPFTPGFLTQSAVAQLLMGGGCPDEATPCGTYVGEMWPFFVAYTFTQMIYVSSLLRIWETEPGDSPGPDEAPDTWMVGRLLIYVVVLAIPLTVAGVFPQMITGITNLAEAIPPSAGDPPSAVASWQVWLTLAGPLALGIGLAVLRSQISVRLNAIGEATGTTPALRAWSRRVARFTALDWFSRITRWGTSSAGHVWDAGLEIVEGAGHVGWVLVFGILGYFLLNV